MSNRGIRISGGNGVLLAVGSLVLALGHADAAHATGCVPARADPSTYNLIDTADGRRFYLEEREVPPPFDTVPPIPMSGFFLGQGTWLYEEANGIDGPAGSLQRGTFLPPGHCDPLPELCFLPGDSLTDEHCGHGPDSLIAGPNEVG